MAGEIKGQGAVISVSTNGTTFTEVLSVKSFGGIGGGAVSIKDVTNLKSTRKEKLSGLIDEGQVTLGGFYMESDAGQEMMRTARSSGGKLTMKVELSNKKTPTGKGTTWVFDIYVLTFKIDGISVDEIATFDSSCEITGAVTETKAS